MKGYLPKIIYNQKKITCISDKMIFEWNSSRWIIGYKFKKIPNVQEAYTDNFGFFTKSKNKFGKTCVLMIKV